MGFMVGIGVVVAVALVMIEANVSRVAVGLGRKVLEEDSLLLLRLKFRLELEAIAGFLLLFVVGGFLLIILPEKDI